MPTNEGVPRRRQKVLFGEEVDVLYEQASQLFDLPFERPDETLWLASLFGDTLKVRRLGAEIPKPTTALGGLRRALWHRMGTRLSDLTPCRYHIAWTPPDSSDQLDGFLVSLKNGSIGLSGGKNIIADSPAERFKIPELKKLATDLSRVIGESDVFSADSFVESKQLGPCSLIRGKEARDAYAVISGALARMAGVPLHTLPPEKYYRMAFEPEAPMTAFQIVQAVIVRKINKEAPDLNALAVSCGFSANPFEEGPSGPVPFLACLVAHYDANGELGNTYASYACGWEPEPYPLGPGQRAQVHRAIQRQIAPETMGE